MPELVEKRLPFFTMRIENLTAILAFATAVSLFLPQEGRAIGNDDTKENGKESLPKERKSYTKEGASVSTSENGTLQMWIMCFLHNDFACFSPISLCDSSPILHL